MLEIRRSKIIDKITDERMVKVTDLMKDFRVSMETIRRDLHYLEERGYLKRVYGGAVVHGLYGEEPSYERREIINFDEKRAIGVKAAELVNDGDTVIIDVGTTCLEVAKGLLRKKNLTVITNAMPIALEMMSHGNCRVIVLGGELRSGELATSGPMAAEQLQFFYANKLMLGVGGISPEHGVTDYHLEESKTRRIMIDRADEVIAVADYSKFGVTAMNCCCPIGRISTLVTDWSTPAQALVPHRAAGIEVISAPRIK